MEHSSIKTNFHHLLMELNLQLMKICFTLALSLMGQTSCGVNAS